MTPSILFLTTCLPAKSFQGSLSEIFLVYSLPEQTAPETPVSLEDGTANQQIAQELTTFKEGTANH